MSGRDNAMHDPASDPGFWRSRSGIAVIVFLVIAAVLLGFEHRIHLFAGSLFPVALLVGCIVMYFFMHGSHGAGGHGSHRKNGTANIGDKP